MFVFLLLRMKEVLSITKRFKKFQGALLLILLVVSIYFLFGYYKTTTTIGRKWLIVLFHMLYYILVPY